MKLVTKETKKLGATGGAWLKKLIDASISKDKNYFDFMGNLRNLLTGEHWKNIKGISKQQIKMIVNLAHAHVRTLVPTLFFQNPSVDCAPTAPQHAGKEKTWNGILNNTFDKTGFAEECKKVVLDSVLFPEGVMKSVVNKSEQPTSEAGSSGPTVWLTKGAPINVRIQPAQLIVDYLTTDRDVENARFVAIRYRKPIQEIRLHPIYGKNIKTDYAVNGSATPTTGNLVRSTTSDNDDWDERDSNVRSEADEQLVTIYEVWIHQLIDNEGEIQIYQQMCVLLEDQDEPIRELESWESVMGNGFNRFPVTRVVLNPIPDRVPTSELGIWQNLQMALNWLMSRITELVENDRLLYAIDSSKLKNPQKARQQFYNGRSREWVEVTAPGAIEMLQPSFVGRDNYPLVNMVQQYIQQVSGIGQNRRGGAGIRTATEASLVDEGTRIKTDEKVDIISKFLIAVISKNTMIIRSLAQSESSSWVFGVGGDIGAVEWISFTKFDIDWLPEVRIRVNSFRKMDSLQEMQKFAGLIQQAVVLFQLYGPTVRVDLLFARMLESAGIYDSGKIVGNQDQQAMLQTIEIAGILAGVPTPVLEEHNHAVHIQGIDAFIQSQFGQQLIAQAPELLDRLLQHKQEHMIQLQELQAKADRVSMAQDPFAAAGQTGESTPQSEALSGTARDRTAVQSVPGGNGEFA